MTEHEHDQEPVADAERVVGYEYQGSTWCPLDLIMHMAATGVLTVDIHEGMSVEDTLRAQARAMGAAYDPARFPRPIERTDAEAEDYCDRCDRVLSEDRLRFADDM